MRTFIFLIVLISLLGCQSKEETIVNQEKSSEPVTSEQVANAVSQPEEPTEPPTPPTPPISEDFEKAPILSLFPRVVDFQPEPEDKERHAYWRSFMEHVSRTSGVKVISNEPLNRALILKSIDTIDSVAYFAPLAVEPNASYEVSFRFKGEIPEGGRAGIAALEFKEFLWIGNQFTESMAKQYQAGVIRGIDMPSTSEWIDQSHTMTVGPQTEMIHLIFYRDGEDGTESIYFDDISIVPIGSQASDVEAEGRTDSATTPVNSNTAPTN